jgi:hypothetical protein
MAKLRIKGLDQEIYLEEEKARAIKKMWIDSTKQSTIVDIDSWSGRVSDIRHIWFDNFSHTLRDVGVDYEMEYLRERDDILAMSLEDRAKRLGMFDILWWSSTGEKEYSDEIKAKAIEIQTKFFTEHPKRCFCDPLLFKGLLPSKNIEINKWQNGGHHFIESAVREDIIHSNV